MKTVTPLKRGSRVLVPWGFGEPREGSVVEVWGDRAKPSHVRVELDPVGPDDDGTVLLLNPNIVERIE